MAGQIALHASLMSAINTIHTASPPLPRAPAVLFMDTIVGLDFQPTHYVDITEQFAEKARLLRMHDSQMQCGVAYAEGFAPALRTPLLRPGWVLPG